MFFVRLRESAPMFRVLKHRDIAGVEVDAHMLAAEAVHDWYSIGVMR